MPENIVRNGFIREIRYFIEWLRGKYEKLWALDYIPELLVRNKTRPPVCLCFFSGLKTFLFSSIRGL